ncbi:hypothetical protein ACFLS1_01370 [Verrucomicrobiota bacterium]
MKKCILAVVVITMILAGHTVVARESAPIIGVTAKVGTLGPGVDLTLNLGSYFNLRGGYNGFTYERSMDMDEAEIDGELILETIPILLDWHPFEGGFRISGGVVLNNNELSFSATPGDEFELEEVHYIVTSLDGEATFNRTSLYIGIGSGNAVDKDGKIHFNCDFGLMFHGAPELEATGTAINPAFQSMLNDSLQAEVDQWEDDAKVFSFWPVLSIGVSICF